MSVRGSLRSVGLAIAVVAAPFACTSANEGPGPGAAPIPRPAPLPRDDEHQRALGEKYYAYDCAGCHGGNGEGAADSPPLVGAGALPVDPPPRAKLRTERFVVAFDLYALTRRHMPADVIGEMTDAYYWEITAYLLARNGVDLRGRVLDEALARTVPLHAPGP